MNNIESFIAELNTLDVILWVEADDLCQPGWTTRAANSAQETRCNCNFMGPFVSLSKSQKDDESSFGSHAVFGVGIDSIAT